MTLLARARAIVAEGKPVAVLRVTKVQGSAPREVGATMLVTANGIAGSIGGGTLEWKALAEAQRRLGNGPSRQVKRFALGPDLGQCCGGQVEITIDVYDQTNIDTLPAENAGSVRTVFLFGAGHVGKAVAFSLSQTDFQVVWVDPRPGAFPAAIPGNVALRDDANVPGVLAGARHGSLVLVMTHSHELDLAIVDASLRRPEIAATGLIGSATKRARFEKRLAGAGVDPARVAALICPIGIGSIRSKRPEAIAISTAAQLLALDERLKLEEVSPTMFSAHRTAAI